MAGRIRIPPYKPLGIATQAVPGGGSFDIDASAGQFGASPLLQLGLQAVQGAAGIAGAVSPYLGSDNEAAVKAADTKLGETEQALLFDPQTGYLNLQGQAALQKAPAVLDAYNEAQARTLDTAADDDQRRMLQELADKRLARFNEVVERHGAAQRQNWYDQVADQRIAAMNADAALHWNSDALLRRALGTARAEVRERAERKGWDSPLSEAALSRETSRVLVSAIGAALDRDPERARSLRTRYAAVIEDTDRAALDALLAEAQTRERAQAASTEILNAAPPEGHHPTPQWRLQQADAITDPAVRAATIRRLNSAAADTEARARTLGEQVLARVLKDGLTDPSQIPVSQWVALDAVRQQAIEARLDHNAAGTEPSPNPPLVDQLTTEMTQAPHDFARRDLVPEIAHLPLPQWQRLRNWQAGLLSNDPTTGQEVYAIKRGLQLADKALLADKAHDEAANARADLVDDIDMRRRLTGKYPDDADIANMLARRIVITPHTTRSLEWDPRAKIESTQVRFNPSLPRPDNRPGIHRVQDKPEPGQDQDDPDKGRDFWDWLFLFLELFSQSQVPEAPRSPRQQTGSGQRRIPPHSTNPPRLPGKPSPPVKQAPAPTTKPPPPAAAKPAPPSTPPEIVKGDPRLWGQEFGRHGADLGFKRHQHQEYRELANRIRNDPNAKVTRYPRDAPRYAGETHYEVDGRRLRLDANGEFVSLRLAPAPPAAPPAAAAPKLRPAGTSHSPPSTDWSFGGHKTMEAWNNQMADQGWTIQEITDAIEKGRRFPAENRVTPQNPAIRFEHPTTGKSVVLDMKTREVLQIRGVGFR